MRRINAETWRLKISGLCEVPKTFTFNELWNLPTRSQSSRLKCVECWSARAQWSGFSIKELEQIVQPHASAWGMVFHCGDEYKEYLSLEALNQDRVLLVHTMNGKALSDAHRFPLRLISPLQIRLQKSQGDSGNGICCRTTGGNLELNRPLLTERNHPDLNRSPSGIQ